MRTPTWRRGVWQAPAGANASLAGVTDLPAKLNDKQSGTLNLLGINCLRDFPVLGCVVWGARTLRGAEAFADDYRYVPVRRLADHIETSLKRGLQWTMFEPNDAQLWAAVRQAAAPFLDDLYRMGAFFGTASSNAWFLHCDASTTTAADIENGVVNVIVGFAPERPAEFVVLQLQLSAATP
ncbi:MAG: phage tail sheath C-terminal domain-containing protein [Sphingomonas sp.]